MACCRPFVDQEEGQPSVGFCDAKTIFRRPRRHLCLVLLPRRRAKPSPPPPFQCGSASPSWDHKDVALCKGQLKAINLCGDVRVHKKTVSVHDGPFSQRRTIQRERLTHPLNMTLRDAQYIGAEGAEENAFQMTWKGRRGGRGGLDPPRGGGGIPPP